VSFKFGADAFRAVAAIEKARKLMADGECKPAYAEVRKVMRYTQRIAHQQRKRTREGSAARRLTKEVERLHKSFGRRCVRERGWLGPSHA
jgi:hypothetical protein